MATPEDRSYSQSAFLYHDAADPHAGQHGQSPRHPFQGQGEAHRGPQGVAGRN